MAEAETKTATKPAPAAAAPAAAAAPKKKIKRIAGVKVKNIHNRTVNLRSGAIEPDAEGYATPAELSTLCKYLEKA